MDYWLPIGFLYNKNFVEFLVGPISEEFLTLPKADTGFHSDILTVRDE
jgi:hypothetical protein